VSAILMLVGWLAIGGAGYYLLSIEEDAAMAVRAQAAGVSKEVNEIEAVVDEAGLKSREEAVERQKIAIEKLKAKQRTPVFVMYELAMMLTDAQQGGAVMIDQEKYKKNRADDPQSEINDRWDPTGLWLTKVVDTGNKLTIEGAARDAADLSEFTRRLRASVWFGETRHPNYERVAEKKGDEEDHRHLTWKLDVDVRRWN
jgi:Tfp pilus assembly protein PilN